MKEEDKLALVASQELFSSFLFSPAQMWEKQNKFLGNKCDQFSKQGKITWTWGWPGKQKVGFELQNRKDIPRV